MKLCLVMVVMVGRQEGEFLMLIIVREARVNSGGSNKLVMLFYGRVLCGFYRSVAEVFDVTN